MDFKKETLSNGLTVIGEINASARSAAVGFFVKTGARDETERINGVSHFLEHMLFKGTERLSAFAVNEAFDGTGAQFNAFTSEETTVYYAAVLPEYLAEITGLWIELMRPALREEDFNIEKNVIKEEIAMYKDVPNFDAMERCKNLHFGKHPCGNSVLGSEKSIDDMAAAQMRDYFSGRYVPDNMVLACAGNFDWRNFVSIADKNCRSWQGHVQKRHLKHCHGSGKQARVEKANLVHEHICLMSQAVSRQDPRRFAAWVLATVIGDANGSRFFWELVDKALAETAALQFEEMDGTGIFSSYIRCSSKNTVIVLDAVRAIFQNLFEKGVTKKEVKAAKNKILSAIVLKNEIPMGRLLDVGFNWSYLQKHDTVEDEINAVKAVTADEINAIIRQLKPGNFTQFSMGPAQ